MSADRDTRRMADDISRRPKNHIEPDIPNGNGTSGQERIVARIKKMRRMGSRPQRTIRAYRRRQRRRIRNRRSNNERNKPALPILRSSRRQSSSRNGRHGPRKRIHNGLPRSTRLKAPVYSRRKVAAKRRHYHMNPDRGDKQAHHL